jgi:hypothetical protein
MYVFKRIFLFLLILLPFFSNAQTFFGISANPADNVALAGPTQSITPVASMIAGDLVCIIAGYKSASATLAISNTGGQIWTAENQAGGATSGVRMRLFWATFNGTWSGNPSVTVTSGSLALSMQMVVFRPSGSNPSWNVAIPIQVGDHAAAPNINTPYINNPVKGVMLAGIMTDDDNTFTHPGGNAMPFLGSSQYRNPQGTDVSIGLEGLVTQGGAGHGGWTEATFGDDAAATFIIAFSEQAKPTISLNTASGAVFSSGTPPVLEFTGNDLNWDDVIT